jgi:hypothetical protein
MEKKLLIVPDVHGRKFWKDVKEYPDANIIFLGDYLDPYTGIEGIMPLDAIENFKEILEFAREHKDNVTLLYGNHDSYAFKSRNLCSCRHDWKNIETIEKLFDENEDLFQLAYEIDINGKHFLFTHAGVNPIWVNHYLDVFDGSFHYSAEELNPLRRKIYALCDISLYRGGDQFVGSMVWSDIREYEPTENLSKRFNIKISDKITFPENMVQICGHTWINSPISLDCKDYIIHCIDVQQVFYIDENGNLRYLSDDKVVETKS